MLLSLCYLVFRGVLQLATLRCCSNDFKDLEIVVLRHELVRRRRIATQQGRQLTWTLADRPDPVRYLIRDRDQKFTDSFDGVFRSDGIQIIRTPFRAPQAKDYASYCTSLV